MVYSFAPLEGLTDYIYRRVHHKHFPGIDRYYTPFLSPTVHRHLTPKEAREIPPADTLGFSVIPQLLTKVAEDFLWMAQKCQELGYCEVNLNVGCPSGTVTAKGKGAGMLKDLDALDAFLEAIFHSAPIPISVKTRIGFDAPEELDAIINIYNRYPIKELIIHPRVRNAFYKGDVDIEAFSHAVRTSRIPLCYNGNLCSISQIEAITSRFPQIESIMLGRGLIGDPGLLTPGGTTPEKLAQFHAELLESYLIAFGGSRNAMFRLKEHWRHLLCKFEGSERLGKQLHKTTDLEEYKSITSQIIHTLPMRQTLQPDW